MKFNIVVGPRWNYLITYELIPILRVILTKNIFSDELLAERENNKRIAHQMDLNYADIAGY